MYLSALKVDYQREARDYKLILQDIAAEVANQKKVTFAPGTRGVNATYTKEGSCPAQGLYMSDGSMFIGNYKSDKWNSDSVKPFHKEITTARGSEGKTYSRSEKKRVNAVKRNKKKLKKLKSQISAAKTKVAAITKDNDEGNNDGDDDGDFNAGDSFGGKSSVKKKNI